MRKFVAALGLICTLALAHQRWFVSAGIAQPANNEIQIEFPAAWLSSITAAYADFKEHRSDLSCFTVQVLQKNGLLLVSIAPPLDITSDGNRLTFPVSPGTSRCGRGIEYYFDKSGKLIQRTIVR